MMVVGVMMAVMVLGCWSSGFHVTGAMTTTVTAWGPIRIGLMQKFLAAVVTTKVVGLAVAGG